MSQRGGAFNVVEVCVGMEAHSWGPAANTVEAFHAEPSCARPGMHHVYAEVPYGFAYSSCNLAMPPGLGQCAEFFPLPGQWERTWSGGALPWDGPSKQALAPGPVEPSKAGRQQANSRRKKQDAQSNPDKSSAHVHQEPPWAEVTTVMMRNLPNKYTQPKLLEELRGNGFEPLRDFDFFYLPMDHCTAVNLGYCFINFIETTVANTFASTFQGKRMQRFNSSKTIQVMPASIQGFERNYAYYSSRRVAQDEDPQYRPLFLRPPPFVEHSHFVPPELCNLAVLPHSLHELISREWGVGLATQQVCQRAPPTTFRACELLIPGAVADDSAGPGKAAASIEGQGLAEEPSVVDFPCLAAGGLEVEPAQRPRTECSVDEPMKASPVSSLEHEKKNNRAGADAPFTFHAAMLGIKPTEAQAERRKKGGETHPAEARKALPAGGPAPADASKAVRRFLRAGASFPSAGSGYITAEEGEELVALHAEGDWYYGYVLLDPQRLGWFPRSKVSADAGSSQAHASLPHLLLRSKILSAPPGAPAAECCAEVEPAAVGPAGAQQGAAGRGGGQGEESAPCATGATGNVEQPSHASRGRSDAADVQHVVRRIVKVRVAFESAGTGYLAAGDDEELVALHAEGDWYYGLVLLDPQRQGWFCRDLVTL